MREYHSKFEEEKCYHIYNRGNSGENIYASDDNYKYFLSKWVKYIAPFTKTLAYCLMPNHFHFFIRVNSEEYFTNNKATDININSLLEDQFKKLFSSYALSYNKQQSRHGSLFEKRFKRVQVDSDSYFSKIIHYIHHGFAPDYSLWKYSSFESITSHRPSLLAREEVLDWFGGKEAFKQFHETQIDYSDMKKITID